MVMPPSENNTSDIHYLCAELDRYLKDRFCYKQKCVLTLKPRTATITAKRKKFDLYFRYKPNNSPWPMNTLVIARIYFLNTHSGNGTDLLCFLLEQSRKLKIKYLAIEQTNENSSLFAINLGFKPMDNSDKCFIGTVEDISNVIENRKERAFLATKNRENH
ncbi:TPA: hypothetical protein ACSP3U_001330 [Aeromonas hydrophila]